MYRAQIKPIEKQNDFSFLTELSLFCLGPKMFLLHWNTWYNNIMNQIQNERIEIVLFISLQRICSELIFSSNLLANIQS